MKEKAFEYVSLVLYHILIYLVILRFSLPESTFYEGILCGVLKKIFRKLLKVPSFFWKVMEIGGWSKFLIQMEEIV